MKKIVLTGGGTAGHVYPALAVAEELQDCELHYIGGEGIEKEILSKYKNIAYHTIPTVKFERKLTLRNFLIPFKLAKSIKCAKNILQEIDPDVIFSKGGFVAVPVAVAGKFENIPVVSHESDLTLGLANKVILRCCDVMCTTFKETANQNKKCKYTGQPIRSQIFHGNKLNLFKNNLPIILVLGGSLGAKTLNDFIFSNLDSLTEEYNILHIYGKNNYEKKSHKNYHIVPYADNIQDYYATADIVISRAGSGVINELLALNKPMLLIPLSKANSRGDQIQNANLFEKMGFAQVLDEKELNLNNLKNKLKILDKNSEKIKKKMQKYAKTDAVLQISKILKKY